MALDREWDSTDQMLWDQGINDLFEALFSKVEKGEMTYEQMERFFPQDVKDRAKEAVKKASADE